MKFGNKIAYEYEYRNISSTVKGSNNIKKVIKDDLYYFLSLPYVLKVDVVKVVLNKIDSETKTYRYKGVYLIEKIMLNMIRHGTQIKIYFSTKRITWTQIMKCLYSVPNALFKMYGDKSKGSTSYNGKIANGGM